MQTRRSFVGTGAKALALAWVAPALLPAAPAAGRRALRRAIMLDTVGIKGSLLERFKAIKEAGFEGVEPLSGLPQDEVVQARDATGLAVPSVCCATHWSQPITDPNPTVRQAGLRGLEQALRDAKRFGAATVLFVPGIVTKQVSYGEAYQRSQEGIRQLVPLAEELGVTIALENVGNKFLLSPLEAVRYVDEFKSARVGWYFDCGNIGNAGWAEQWIRLLGKRVVRIHVKEFSRKKPDKDGRGSGFDVQLLEGDNDWPAIMAALDEFGYSGWLISEQGGAGNLAGMKNIAERMERILSL